MGFRTVVMLNNDQSHEWSKDPELGTKIAHAMSSAGHQPPPYKDYDRWSRCQIDNYGTVVQCVHADDVSVVKLTNYTNFEVLGHTYWGHDHEAETLRALKDAAEKLGYKLVKKPLPST